MMKKFYSLILLLFVMAAVHVVYADTIVPKKVKRTESNALILTKPTTITDVAGYQGVDVSFEPGEEVDEEAFTYKHTMGSLLLDAPAAVKWQIGRFTLSVNYFSYETNYDSEDWNKNENVYAVGTMLNQRTPVEARQIEMKISDTQGMTWLMFSVPYDVNVNDIKGGRGRWVIRRYDAAKRAAVKSGETWVDVKAGETLKAGEAYIFMRDYSSLYEDIYNNYNEDDDWDDDEDPDDYLIALPAAETAAKQNIFASGDVVVPLKKNAAERAHNANWNFVGNPYPCFYDFSAIKEKADLYFWDDDYQMYQVFSTGEDNGFVLAPGQGFFVQANDISQLTFPASGRCTSGNFHLPEKDENWDDNDDWNDEDWGDEWSNEARAKMNQLKKQLKQLTAKENVRKQAKKVQGDFNPASLPDPGANYFNAQTGEALFDLISSEPGMFLMAARNLLNEGADFKKVKSVIVEAPLGQNFIFMLFTNCERVNLSQSGGFSTLPAGAFAYMMNLHEVALPPCVTAIDPEAFLLCPALEQIDCYATTPPTVSEAVFTNMQNSNLDNMVVRVPKEAVTAYKTAPVWKTLNIQSLEGGETLQSVTMAVLTPEGRDIAGQCGIVWRADDGTMMGTGSELLGVAEGTKVTYSVSLPSVLVTVYEPVAEGTHTVTASDNQITVNLVATGVVDLGSLDLHGSMGTLTFDYVPSDDTSAALNTNDVKLTITDKATGTALTDYVCQYPEVYFEKTRLAQGQVVTVTATSRSGAFQTTEAEATADADGNFNLTMTLRENGHGRLVCTRAEGVTSFMAMVFNGDGNYVGRYEPNGNVITVSGLEDGTYLAVVMQETPYFTVVPTAADLELAGLIKDVDFAYTLINLKAGTSKSYDIHIPYLDEERLKRIDPASYLTTTTPTLTLMQTGTLKAKVVSKADYMAKVSNLRLIIDFPEGTHYQEGSLITTKSDGSYQLSGRRLVVPCELDEQVKCCLVPDQSGKYNITAMAQYTMDGQQYTQPIGVTVIDVAYTSLNLPNPTNTPTLHPNGYTYPNSTVTIYDGDYVIGETTANSNGFFETDVTLRPAYDDSYHQVHAIAKREGAEPVALESQLILYDKDASMISEISMIYQGQRITWNKLNGTYTPHYYDVNPANSGRATFTAKLLNPQPDKILFPAFEVATSDGKGYRLSAKWNAGSQTYTATHNFSNVECLPIGAQFHFQYSDPSPKDRSELYDKFCSSLVSMFNTMAASLDKRIQVGDVLEDTEDRLSFTFTLDGQPEKHMAIIQAEEVEKVLAMRNERIFERYKTATDSMTVCAFGDDSSLTVYTVNLNTNEALSMVLRLADSANESRTLRRAAPSGTSAFGVLNGLKELGGHIKNYLTLEDMKKEVDQADEYLKQMKWTYYDITEREQYLVDRVKAALAATCPDGTSRIPDGKIAGFNQRFQGIDSHSMYSEMDATIQNMRRAIDNIMGQYAAGYAIDAVGGKLVKKGLVKYGGRVLVKLGRVSSKIGNAHEVADALGGAVNDALGQAAGEAVNKFLPKDWKGIKTYYDEYVEKTFNELRKEYWQLHSDIVSSYKECDEDDDDGDDDDDDEDPEPVPHPQVPHPVTPIVDPSGFVYEGVEGNRVEGVTATIYYKENESGAEQQWDAEEFGQQNPQVTNGSGIYMWNVPKGLWQVRFAKDGYEPTQTEWLPVPPPQLDIMVPMTQHTTPVVTKANADENGVSISFSKYMQTASLTGISVRQDGVAVSGRLLFPEAQDGLTKRVHFMAETPFTAQEVQLTVPAEAKSYAGDVMAAADVRTLTVERVIEDLVVQTDAAIQVGDVGYLQVIAYPAIAVVGKTLNVSINSPLVELAEGSLTFDDRGQVLVPLRGLLPGAADISCAIGDLKATSVVRVKYVVRDRVAQPFASIINGSVVPEGTQVELFCTTDGAVIWYTTDGSCPCDETTRKRYTEPIVINGTMTIRAMAVCDGMDDSEVVSFTYTVGSTGITQPRADAADEAYYSLRGTRIMEPLAKGIYIHVQRIPQGVKSRKVIVK